MPKLPTAQVKGIYKETLLSQLGSAIRNWWTMTLLYIYPQKATFHTPFTALGMTPEGCSSITFPAIFGPSVAAEMMYMGRKLSAAEALQYGLVSRVYTKDTVEEELWPKLRQWSSLPPKVKSFFLLFIYLSVGFSRIAGFGGRAPPLNQMNRSWDELNVLEAIVSRFFSLVKSRKVFQIIILGVKKGLMNWNSKKCCRFLFIFWY